MKLGRHGRRPGSGSRTMAEFLQAALHSGSDLALIDDPRLPAKQGQLGALLGIPFHISLNFRRLEATWILGFETPLNSVLATWNPEMGSWHGSPGSGPATRTCLAVGFSQRAGFCARQDSHFILDRMPFPPAQVYDCPPLTDLLADGIVGRKSRGTSYLHFEPEVHWCQWHRRGRKNPRLRGAVGLRARLSCVQAVADAADPPEGWCGFRLQPHRLALIRYRRPAVAGGAPPQRPLRRHRRPPRRSTVRLGPAAGYGPATPTWVAVGR